jgi:nitroimidazol reductase NimA-like FMN-containing flavoprotein (pyridoxamine 5'-phosphate oxidase superfamily)
MPKLDLSLTAEERDAFLDGRKTVRVATVGRDGAPHVVPLWFVWLDGTLFLNSTLGNVTVENARRTGRASAVVDDGEEYEVLRGVVLSGRVEEADGDPRLPEVSDRWSRKYLGGNPVPYGKWRHRAWFRLDPDRIASWDFRKIPEARARRDAARREGA